MHTDKVIMTVPSIAAESPAHHAFTSLGSKGELNQNTNAKTNTNKPTINKTQAAIDDRALKIGGILHLLLNSVAKVYSVISVCQYRLKTFDNLLYHFATS